MQRRLHRLLFVTPLLHSGGRQPASPRRLLERGGLHVAGSPPSHGRDLHQCSRGLVCHPQVPKMFQMFQF